MGIISSEINKDHYKYILLEDIVLLAQSMDSDKPSLADTAKFLLAKYDDNDFPFGNVDDRPFEKNLSGRYQEINETKPLFHFLKFVAIYNCFDHGTTEDNPNFVIRNKYQDIYLEKEEVFFFLSSICGLCDEKISLNTNLIKIKDGQSCNTDAPVNTENLPAIVNNISQAAKTVKEPQVFNEQPLTLKLANKAFSRFWGNANPLERDTHPENRDISKWIQEESNHEISKTMADKIAQVIRPEWAATGRKPQI